MLLDYGGVLTSSVTGSFAAFCRAEGIDVDIFRTVVLDAARSADSMFHAVEVGKIDQDEFDRLLAKTISKATGKQVDPAGLKQRLFAGSMRDEEMMKAVRRIRAGGIKTALVSNSWGGADYPRELFDGLFDASIISGEVGLRKPNADIYLLAASRVELDPSECVFVDDFQINVRGAEAVGMRGIHHHDTLETIRELEDIFGVDVSGGTD
ncbi:MAG: HAD family hydrolase [Actinomycetota bacterium]